jgi:hypothetical protein
MTPSPSINGNRKPLPLVWWLGVFAGTIVSLYLMSIYLPERFKNAVFTLMALLPGVIIAIAICHDFGPSNPTRAVLKFVWGILTVFPVTILEFYLMLGIMAINRSLPTGIILAVLVAILQEAVKVGAVAWGVSNDPRPMVSGACFACGFATMESLLLKCKNMRSALLFVPAHAITGILIGAGFWRNQRVAYVSAAVVFHVCVSLTMCLAGLWIDSILALFVITGGMWSYVEARCT